VLVRDGRRKPDPLEGYDNVRLARDWIGLLAEGCKVVVRISGHASEACQQTARSRDDAAHRTASFGPERHLFHKQQIPVTLVPSPHMSFQPVFNQFQLELDDHNDRRERLIKVNTHDGPYTDRRVTCCSSFVRIGKP
jgi:hypothetical protein